MTPANIAGMASVAGLQIIALTDHNSTGNCAPLIRAAARFGITALYGMELTTQEEVHVVCLFESAGAAGQWQAFVNEKLLSVQNNPAIFGRQCYMDEFDAVLGEEPNLLINATAIPFDAVFGPVFELGGVAFPAHIEKPANALLANLGFIPPQAGFTVAELRELSCLEALKKAHPHLNHCKILSSSDAHYLQDIGAAGQQIFLEENSAACLIHTLRN